MSVKPEDETALLRNINSNPNFKGGWIESLSIILHLNHGVDLMTDDEYRYCKEVFLMIPVVIYAQHDFYLLKAINKKIEAFTSAGLIDYWLFKNLIRDREASHKTNMPKVLTIDHLSGSFQILLFGYFASFILLMLEIFCSLFK